MEEGKRFSLVYLDRSKPTRDSLRLRNRLASFFWEYLHKYHNSELIKIIQLETGAVLPAYGYGYNLGDFFKKNELRDILDSITLIYQTLKGNRASSDAEKWKLFVERSFKEENLGYRLDRDGGVHYFVDEEFERNRFSTLNVLDDSRYAAVRTAYEDAYRYLDNNPIDTKAAVRSIFESIEILVKQMVETNNLNKWIVENTLKAKCLSHYKNDKTANKVASQMFDGFALWVDGLHNYRHGQGEEQPVAPSEELVVYILSSGSSFLRWLIGINNNLT